MKRPLRPRHQDGIATVEFALILVCFVFIMMLPLYLGRVMWHYSAAQKAAHDAARYLASASVQDMSDLTRAGYVVAMANSIAAAETSDLNPGGGPVSVTSSCGQGGACGAVGAPTAVTVFVQMTVADIFFPNTTTDYLGTQSTALTAAVTYPYVGQ